MLALQLFQRDAAHKRMLRCQQRPNHVVFAVLKAGVLEAEALGEQAEHLHIGLRFSRRGQCRARQLQIVVPVSEIQIGVFQERGGRQQDVRVIGRAGLELLQHHGKQVVAAQPAPHQILIGRDRRRVGVVHHQRFHRRIVQGRERPSQLRHVDHPRLAPQRRP